jgi:hypothetical protein
MFEEAVVFGRQECLNQLRRYLVVAHGNAALVADDGYELAVARVDA